MDKEEHLVTPESERKCVWMTSGVISYKLCPGNYLCEECMFDRVMRNESAAMIRRPDVDAALAADLASIDSSALRIDGSLFYHRSHCWVKIVNSEEVMVGINGILARLIYGIKTVVLPKAGEVLSRGQFFAHIIQEKHIIPLTIPVNGVITEVNHDLVETPELLRKDFWGQGWLVLIKPDNLENDLRTLACGSNAVEWYRNKERSVSEAIHAVYSVSRGDLRPAMHDGGELMLNSSEIISSDLYYKIIEELFRD